MLENESEDPVNWEIDTSDKDNPDRHGAFTVSKTKGVLDFGE
jgi:hypothetical protein